MCAICLTFIQPCISRSHCLNIVSSNVVQMLECYKIHTYSTFMRQKKCAPFIWHSEEDMERIINLR